MTTPLPQSVDEMQDIIDIEGIVRNSLPDLIYKILIVIAVLFLVISLIILVKKFINKRKSGSVFLLPDQKAVQAIEKLKKSGYISEKAWNLFYFSLDEILRRYLSEAFSMDVLDKTFEELKTSAQKLAPIQNGTFEKMILEFWQRAQLIKFAKQQGDEKTANQDLEAILQFVRTTGRKHE